MNINKNYFAFIFFLFCYQSSYSSTNPFPEFFTKTKAQLILLDNFKKALSENTFYRVKYVDINQQVLDYGLQIMDGFVHFYTQDCDKKRVFRVMWTSAECDENNCYPFWTSLGDCETPKKEWSL